MTVIIGYVDRKSRQTYMGCDRCASNSVQKFTIAQSKIYQPSENPNFLIGFAGDPRVKQLITSNITFPTEKQLEAEGLEVNERFLVTAVIPTMQKSILDNQYYDPNLEGSQILLAYKDNLWTIGYGYQLISVDGDYMSIGSGCYTANGVLEALKNDLQISILDKIINALKISSKLANGVEGPYDLYISSLGKLSDESLKSLVDDESKPEVYRTNKLNFIKKVLKKKCNGNEIIDSVEENNKISYMTDSNKSDIYFLDFDGVIGCLRDNGDVVYNVNVIDDFNEDKWDIVELNSKGLKAIESINKFNLNEFEDDENKEEDISNIPELSEELANALANAINNKE